MKSIIALLPLVAVAACSPPVVAVSGDCPMLPTYTADKQAQTADELEELGDDSVLGVFVADYGSMRDAVQECIEARNGN